MEIPAKPTDIEGLFGFYHEFVKLLYCDISAEAELPPEILFEIHAAFDHLSRIYVYGEDHDFAIEKAYSHLKRSCLDVFKIRARDAAIHWEDISKVQGLELIDNGDFKRNCIALIAQIKDETRKARYAEGQASNDEQRIEAFDKWAPVYAKCKDFEDNFYQSPKVNWAKVTFQKRRWKELLITGVISYVAGLFTVWTPPALSRFFSWLSTFLKN